MACFEKAKTPVANEGRKKVIPCITLTCIKAAIIRPAASFFEPKFFGTRAEKNCFYTPKIKRALPYLFFARELKFRSEYPK